MSRFPHLEQRPECPCGWGFAWDGGRGSGRASCGHSVEGGDTHQWVVVTVGAPVPCIVDTFVLHVPP